MSSTEVEAIQWTEGLVADAIEQSRHKEPFAWVCIRQCPNAPAYGKTRTADLLAMGCWKSVEVALHGYEIKVSRSDWQREMQDHTKAAAFTKHCHYWWVAAPKGIVKPEELPVNWGLLEVARRPNGAYVSKVRKTVTKNNEASLNFDFFAACLRQCRITDDALNEMNKKIRAEYERGYSKGKESCQNDARIEALTTKVSELTASIFEFEKASGVRINTYGNTATKIGDAVHHVIHNGKTSLASVRWIQEQVDQFSKVLKSWETAATLKDDTKCQA